MPKARPKLGTPGITTHPRVKQNKYDKLLYLKEKMTPRKHTCNSDSEILKVKGWAKNTRQIQFTLKKKKKEKTCKNYQDYSAEEEGVRTHLFRCYNPCTAAAIQTVLYWNINR